MAIPAGAVWEIRADGSDSNGGLYYSAQPGAVTDYSRQAAAQLSLADVVTDGSTSVTSATGGFTAAMIGNGINIAGACYLVATRSDTNTITVDRVIAAAAGQAAKVGGALASPGYASGQGTTANQFWMKAGAYTLTSSSANVGGGKINSPGGSSGFPCKWEGYQTARGDKGTKPVIDEGAITGINMVAAGSAYTIFDNISVNVVDAGSVGLYLGARSCRAIRCKVSGSGTGIYLPNSGTSAVLCESTAAAGPFLATARACFAGCVAHGATGAGFVLADECVVTHCLAYSNGSHGFDGGNGTLLSFTNCTAYGNTGSGFALTSTGASNGAHAINCLSVGNGAYGFRSAAAAGYMELIHCATYNNTSGATNNLTLTEGAVVLTGDPFTAAGTNFGLNSTAGAGAACRAAGVPGAFPGLAATIGYPDLGAVQHQDAGGGGSSGGGSGRLSLSL